MCKKKGKKIKVDEYRHEKCPIPDHDFREEHLLGAAYLTSSCLNFGARRVEPMCDEQPAACPNILAIFMVLGKLVLSLHENIFFLK